MTTTDTTVAQTILSQLGGRLFTLSTGAKNLTAHPSALSFRLPGGGGFCKAGINYVKVTLTPADTYDVTFARVRGMKVTTVAEHTDIYADQLRGLFCATTGLSILGIPAKAMRQFDNRHED